MKVAGIDPGKKGAICIANVLEKNDSIQIENIIIHSIPYVSDIPDYKKIVDIISGVDIVYIEKVHTMPHQGIASSGKFMYDFGFICGILSLLVEYKKIGKYVTISPQKWKNIIFGKQHKKLDKRDSISTALKIVDKKKLIPNGARTPSDGYADALLIMISGIVYMEE